LGGDTRPASPMLTCVLATVEVANGGREMGSDREAMWAQQREVVAWALPTGFDSMGRVIEHRWELDLCQRLRPTSRGFGSREYGR
jgi:hypothetical protein